MELKIHVSDIEGIYVEVPQGNGMFEKKYLNFQDLESIFRENMNIETGILPQNCIYYSKGNNSYACVIQVNAQPNVEVILSGRGSSGSPERYKVPIPYVLFGCVVKEGRLQYSICATSKVPVTNDKVKLCKFPYGNVFDNYNICWGSVTMPNFAEPKDLSNIPAMFFNGSFNGDLYSGVNKSEKTLRDHFIEMNEQPMYPIKYLKDLRSETFADFLNTLRGHM